MVKGNGRSGGRNASLGPSHAKPKAAPIARPSTSYEEMLKHRAYGGASKDERDAVRKQEAEARQAQRESGEQVNLGKSGDYWKQTAAATSKARPAEAPDWVKDVQKASWTRSGKGGKGGGRALIRRSLTPPPSFAPSGRGPWSSAEASPPGISAMASTQLRKAAAAAAGQNTPQPRSEDLLAMNDPWQKTQPTIPPTKASAPVPCSPAARTVRTPTPQPTRRGMDPLAAEDPWLTKSPAASKAAAPANRAPTRQVHAEPEDAKWENKNWWEHDVRGEEKDERQKWQHDEKWHNEARWSDRRWTHDKWESDDEKRKAEDKERSSSELSLEDKDAVDKCVTFLRQSADMEKAIRLVNHPRSGISSLVAEAAVAKVRCE